MVIAPTIEAANIGMADTLILMVLALVVFGPRRLPKIGRQIGKLMYEFRKASNDFRFQMEEELRNAEEADRRKQEEAERQRAMAATPVAQIEATATRSETKPAGSEGTGAAETAATTQSSETHDAAYIESAASEAVEQERRLEVRPPASGAPVPAERPTSRALETTGGPDGPNDETAAAENARPQYFFSTNGEAADAAKVKPAEESAGGIENAMREQAPTPREDAAPETAHTEPATHHG